MDRLQGLNRSFLIPAAWLLDQFAGDTDWLPHSVRLIGLAISRGELALRRPGQSKRAELLLGEALTLAVVPATYYATRQLIRLAKRQSPSLGHGVELLLAWTCLAARNLEQEAAAVIGALDSGNLAHARHRLARIVGRDTQHLDTAKICRATIETLAESASDGIVAPLFYMAVGGVPLAMAYKAINTMDSMIGHADERYFFFGKAAARLDDAANYVPARLTAGLIVAASGLQGSTNPRAALRTWSRDGAKHKSPNAGQPESAMAGALGVQLGGDNTYAGELLRSQRIGHEFVQPSLPQAKAALRLVSFVTLLGVACATLLSAAVPTESVGGVPMSGLVPMHGGQLRQISERFHIPASQLMDFSANINPDGPPPAVLSTLRTSVEDASMLTAYPDLEQIALKQSIASYAGVRPENIGVANGFLPLLQSALPALKVRRCLVPVPAFVEYRRSLAQAAVEIEPHILNADTNLEYDVSHLADALAKGVHDAVLLANPQNPSGVLTPKDVLLQLVSSCAQRNVTVLVDEAFIDYTPLHSLTADVERFPNLIVFRSVTKFHSIPGLRVAYAVANEIIAPALSAFLPPWPITTLASCGAASALADHAFATHSRLHNVQRRARLKAALDAICIRTYPAPANFLLLRLPEGVSAEQFWRRMIVEHHMVLRDCSNYEALPPRHFRTAVHTEEKNEQLVRAVASSLASS